MAASSDAETKAAAYLDRSVPAWTDSAPSNDGRYHASLLRKVRIRSGARREIVARRPEAT